MVRRVVTEALSILQAGINVFTRTRSPAPAPFASRSMELLQLRRDRVVRADSVIDKNQALILSAPNLLPRLMELLRIMNFNPPLALFGGSSKRKGGEIGRDGIGYVTLFFKCQEKAYRIVGSNRGSTNGLRTLYFLCDLPIPESSTPFLRDGKG